VDYSNVESACRALREAGYAVVAGADRLDRTAQLKPAMYLRGTENFMSDLALQPELAECILEHIAGYYLEYNRRFFRGRPAGRSMCSSWGTTWALRTAPGISVPMYRRFFKARLAAYCALAHRFGMKDDVSHLRQMHAAGP